MGKLDTPASAAKATQLIKKLLGDKGKANVRVPLKRTPVKRHGRKNQGRNYHSFITVLSPIESVSEYQLTELVETAIGDSGIDDGAFGQCPMLHMLRFHLIDNLWPALGQTAPDNLKTRYLLLIADIDGEPADFYDCLYRVAPGFVHKVWGNCMEYPPHRGAVFFRRYMQRCSLRTQLPFAAFPESVQEIQRSLDTQLQLVSWLAENQGISVGRQQSWQAFMAELDERAAADRGIEVLQR